VRASSSFCFEEHQLQVESHEVELGREDPLSGRYVEIFDFLYFGIFLS